MNDVKGWFPQGNIDTLQILMDRFDVQSVIEIGAFLGKSTIWFAERCARVTAVEPFDALENITYPMTPDFIEQAKNQRVVYDHNLKESGVFDKVTTLSMTSEEAQKQDIAADLVYIDGSHEYEDVKNDIKWWLPKAIKVLVGDDYSPHWAGVRQAVDESGLIVDKNQRVWFHVKQ